MPNVSCNLWKGLRDLAGGHAPAAYANPAERTVTRYNDAIYATFIFATLIPNCHP
jgi:hypothetical protein